MALTLSVINVCATAQTYQSPTVAQSVYPPANSNLTGSTTHMSAYSYGDLYIDGTQRDLYVYTWDRGEAGGGGGFAVREFPTGTPVDALAIPTYEDSNPSGFPTSDASSVDAVILKWANDFVIAVTYYNWSNQKFMLDFYKWDTVGTNHLVQITGSVFPIELGTTLSSPTHPFGWVHIDAYGLENYVVVYDASGEIVCQAGDVNGSLGLQPGNA